MYSNIILLLNMGLAAGNMEPFIVGGDYTDIKRFPYSTYLYVECMTTFMCGGSILNSKIMLTAGHCLYECTQKHDYKIVSHFGHSSINQMKSLQVTKFLIHDQYNEDELENDLGLLYIKSSLPLGEFVQRVAIVSRYPSRATGGYVTGWGMINTQGETALKLKYIYQELQNNKMCEELIHIPPGSFCARSNSKKQHPDQGDSGGAFVVYSLIQIGLVSFKHIDYDLIAYTNVTYFSSWIKTNAVKLTCDNFF